MEQGRMDFDPQPCFCRPLQDTLQMNTFVWLRRIWIGIALLAGTAGAGQDVLVGQWQFAEASFSVPDSCRATIFEYTADGMFVGNDGSFEERKRYTAKPYKNGFHVEFQYVSNNGKNNCQGLPATYVQRNTIETVYIEVVNTETIKIYFGSEETPGFILFKKQNTARPS
jgi:hypothetical protein